MAELQQLEDDHAIVHMVELQYMDQSDQGKGLPQCIAEVLAEYDSCFNEPEGLPPARAFDHKITLMPGVQPVNVKPYRYSPQQKDEIERQVRNMRSNMELFSIAKVHLPYLFSWSRRKMGLGGFVSTTDD